MEKKPKKKIIKEKFIINSHTEVLDYFNNDKNKVDKINKISVRESYNENNNPIQISNNLLDFQGNIISPLEKENLIANSLKTFDYNLINNQNQNLENDLYFQNNFNNLTETERKNTKFNNNTNFSAKFNSNINFELKTNHNQVQKSRFKFVYDNCDIEFNSDFDSGNIKSVNQLSHNDSKFVMEIAYDCEEFKILNKNKSWFFFTVITNFKLSKFITLMISNIASQSKYYHEGYKPVYYVVTNKKDHEKVPLGFLDEKDFCWKRLDQNLKTILLFTIKIIRKLLL